MDRTAKYLFDIQTSIARIEEFLVGTDNFDTYQKDFKTQSAVERQLAIIGEIVSKLKQENPTLQLANAQKMIDFRNRLIHAYDNIDNTIVWAILKRHLANLKEEVNKMLNIDKVAD